MQRDFRGMFRAVGICALIAWSASFAAHEALADAKERLTGSDGKPLALQDVIRAPRPVGPVFVAIPIAYVFGLRDDRSPTDRSPTYRSPTYCSPTIRATNSSNQPVEELIVGIEYQTTDRQPAGRTVTRYDKIKIGQQDTHYFYQLTVNDCRGLEGRVTVERCKYANGDDCAAQVTPIGFGTIPLYLHPR